MGNQLRDWKAQLRETYLDPENPNPRKPWEDNEPINEAEWKDFVEEFNSEEFQVRTYICFQIALYSELHCVT